MPLIQKNDDELRVIIRELSDDNFCKGCTLEDEDDYNADFSDEGSAKDNNDQVWYHIPVAVFQALKSYEKDPLYSEDIAILFQQYSGVIELVKDPESKRFLRKYLNKNFEGIPDLFDSSKNL